MQISSCQCRWYSTVSGSSHTLLSVFAVKRHCILNKKLLPPFCPWPFLIIIQTILCNFLSNFQIPLLSLAHEKKRKRKSLVYPWVCRALSGIEYQNVLLFLFYPMLYKCLDFESYIHRKCYTFDLNFQLVYKWLKYLSLIHWHVNTQPKRALCMFFQTTYCR